MKRSSPAFLFSAIVEKEVVGEGIVRQLLGHDDSILMARVTFEEGAVGYIHSHFHSQASYVESGEFDIMINGVEKRLGPGDGFYVKPDFEHGAVCRKAGVLLDVFSPAREDFLEERKE